MQDKPKSCIIRSRTQAGNYWSCSKQHASDQYQEIKRAPTNKVGNLQNPAADWHYEYLSYFYFVNFFLIRSSTGHIYTFEKQQHFINAHVENVFA